MAVSSTRREDHAADQHFVEENTEASDCRGWHRMEVVKVRHHRRKLSWRDVTNDE
jgi:hypothetical protein